MTETDTIDRKLLINKISRPKITGILQRQRLLDRLDVSQETPITWIHGPGGSGKSTLVAGYLHDRNRASVWYQLDHGDEDLATFFFYLGLAIQKISPAQRQTLPLFTAEYQSDAATFARRYFERLFLGRSQPVTIVFDNYQSIPIDSQLHDILRCGLDAVPAGSSVIVISREAPPTPFARLLATNPEAAIVWEDLQYTVDEIQNLVLHKTHAEVSNQQINRLHQLTEGWAVGVVLLIEQLKDKDKDALTFENIDLEHITDYFSTEVLDTVNEETRQFLLHTSFLPQMTLPLVEALTGSDKARQILAWLARHHYFTTRQHKKEITYQYHQMFRESLQAKAEEELPADMLRNLKSKSASLLAKAGLIKDAGMLYSHLADWNAISEMACQHAPMLVSQGRSQLLECLLEHLPSEKVNADPWVLFWLGACKMSSNFSGARSFFERAYPLFEHREDSTGLYLSWAGIVDSIVYEWADFSRLDRWIEVLHLLMQRYPAFPSPEVEGRVAGSMFGALMFHMPEHEEIERWAERVMTITRCSQDPAYRIMIGNQLGLYHLWWTGDHTRLGIAMDLMRPAGKGENLPPLARIIWTGLCGFQQWGAGLCSQAQATFEEAVAIASETGVHVWDFMLYFLGVVSHLSAGNHHAGGKLLESLLATIDRTQHLNVAHSYYVAAWQAALANNPQRALECALTAVETDKVLGGPFTRAAVFAAFAQALHLCARYDEADSYLEQSLELAVRMKTPLLTYRNLMVKASFALDRGNEERCLDVLRQALPIGSKGGYMNFSWWQDSVMTPLCIKALDAGIEVEYVQRLIMTRRIVPTEPPVTCEHWPWQVRIFTLGAFRIRIAGKDLEFTGKVQKKPLELLKALVSFGGENVPEERLFDTLWADVEGDAARNSLKVTISRLREMLGSDQIVRHQKGRISIDRCAVWIDAWAYERLSIEAQLKGEKGDVTGAVQCTEIAQRLYCGHFMAGENSQPWMVSLRKRLKSRFLLNVVTLGNLQQKEGNHRKAAEIYLQGLEIDDMAEELYQNLMYSYRDAGLHAEAASTYRRCQLTLATHGLSPSEKTKEIYRTLLAG